MGKFLDEDVDVLSISSSCPSKAPLKRKLPNGAGSMVVEKGRPRISASLWSIELGIRNSSETSKACQTHSPSSRSCVLRKHIRQTGTKYDT
jgi:hypothetical protein